MTNVLSSSTVFESLTRSVMERSVSTKEAVLKTTNSSSWIRRSDTTILTTFKLVLTMFETRVCIILVDPSSDSDGRPSTNPESYDRPYREFACRRPVSNQRTELARVTSRYSPIACHPHRPLSAVSDILMNLSPSPNYSTTIIS